LKNRNGPGIDDKIRQTDANRNLYYVSDHLGSTTALTDQNGSVIEQQTYDSFGNSTGSSLTRYTYTGREFDSDTGLYYYRARWYDPQVGRFISEDPIGFDADDVNLYAYVGSDPVNDNDPLGLKRRRHRQNLKSSSPAPALPQHTLTIEHFDAGQESWIRYEMQFILTPKCSCAYEAEHLNSPSSIISNRGVVIRHAKDLGERSAADLGVEAETYRKAQTKVNSGQGGTLVGIDGTLQIYLNSYAFIGPTWDGKLFSLAEVLKHEFIHEGIKEWRSPWHPFSHDLRGFPGYDRIMEGCK